MGGAIHTNKIIFKLKVFFNFDYYKCFFEASGDGGGMKQGPLTDLTITTDVHNHPSIIKLPTNPANIPVPLHLQGTYLIPI